MADITLFKSPSVTVEIIDGVPPADQSAEVAALTASVGQLTTERDAANASVAVLQAKIAAAQAALA
jgi:hypothetical protein